MMTMTKDGYPLKDSKDEAAKQKLAALNKVRRGSTDFKPVEIKTSTASVNLSSGVASLIGEAGRPYPLGLD